jgi:hypothetical protein
MSANALFKHASGDDGTLFWGARNHRLCFNVVADPKTGAKQ